ncbi:alpha/beta hydrolase [Aspergillus saccharolyticus JOP 1030-1]|uniref:Esterase n=1 Tax=Aspergillus saccharolyticus JOP 1030-1 TaxID=1450539 RepID=A0A318ZET9_9EURO|nr:esterase [Aspergillus saccharolyticus JOP 1030-1]PYH46056.1 esterase [Aspergillus saccharolyticus JOP 1030-1]
MSHEALNPIHPTVLPYLDPVFIDLYNKHVANTPNGPIDLAVLRSKYSVLYSYGTGPAPEPAQIYDTTIPGHNGDLIPCRVYEPDCPGPWPVHLDFHGGGWGLGDLETESHICKHIAVKARVAVVDIAYRLVPENAFPIGIQDSFAALQYLTSNPAAVNQKFRNLDTTRISLGGVSAGANIALILAHLARDHQIPIRLVAVGTPVIDDISKYATAAESPFASMREMEFAPTLNWARLKWFDRLKWSSLGREGSDRQKKDPKEEEEVKWYANALNAPDFTNLPRTVLYTAGCDPLRDEGEAYARKLIEGGCEVTMRRFAGVPHPFMHMDQDLWQAKEFIDLTAGHVKAALHS